MTIQEETLHSNIETVNSKQLAILKNNFPQCFDKEGNFIQEKMLEVVNANDVELSKESYTLNWLGKSYARLLTNLPPKALINEDVEHNQLKQNKDSNNLLIKGDNLEVLKHMVNAYSEKVKMIYIDPPYNTGSGDFVYDDDRKFTKEQLSDLAGIDLDEAERILEFTDKGSSSHSAWLTFMYPRLYIARELLKEDGVIFISIDDNEQAQLKVICDEIFGEANFISNIIWQKKYSPQNDATYLSDMHDHILLYAKNKDIWRPIPLPRTDKQNSAYKNPDNDYRGGWKSTDSTCNKSRAERPNLYYPIIRPDGKEIFPLESRVWRYSQDVHLAKQVDNRVWWGKNASNDVPAYKSFLNEVKDGRVPTTIWSYQEAGHNQEAKRELNELIKESPFSTPKPTKLIQLACSIAVRPSENDIIMDFFAGSGTSAQAVQKMNSADGGNRKFVLVQLPELCIEKSEAYKAGYKTIFDITKTRITKSAQKIKEEQPEFNGDLGFKIYETVGDFRVTTDEELTLSQPTMFDDVMLTDEQYHTLLTTWVLYDGSLLTTPIETIDLADYQAHYCDGRLYLIASSFSTNALKALLTKLDEDKAFAPHKVVFYGNNFESAKQMELNEALKSYANKKSLELEVVVRY